MRGGGRKGKGRERKERGIGKPGGEGSGKLSPPECFCLDSSLIVGERSRVGPGARFTKTFRKNRKFIISFF